MNLRPERNIFNRESIPCKNIRFRTRMNRLSHLQSRGSDNVSLFAIDIIDQGNARRAVRIVLDSRHFPRNAELVTLEVDDPIAALVASTAMADGHLPIIIATTCALLIFKQ